MDDDQSIVIVPRDSADVARLELATELERLPQQGVTPIVETITGLFASGKWGGAAVGGRIVQGALKYKLFEQVAKEIRDLRAKGKIADDFAEKKYAFNSWVELFKIIDEETPDEDRLEALKAMFYSVNKVDATDGEKIAAYQLFQIAKRLSSGQLLYLKASYELYKSGDFRVGTIVAARDWCLRIGKRLGHGVVGLLDKDDLALVEHGLLTPRYHGDNSGTNVNNAHLSDLGIKFCKNIEEYHIESTGQRPSPE